MKYEEVTYPLAYVFLPEGAYNLEQLKMIVAQLEVLNGINKRSMQQTNDTPQA